MLLKKEQLTAAPDAPVFEIVDVPEFGSSAQVAIRLVGGDERGTVERIANDVKKANPNDWWKLYQSLMVCASICDGEGNPIDFNVDDVRKFSKRPGAGIDRLFDVSNRFNRWVAVSTEDAKKNSPTDPSSSSGTTSPSPSENPSSNASGQ